MGAVRSHQPRCHPPSEPGGHATHREPNFVSHSPVLPRGGPAPPALKPARGIRGIQTAGGRAGPAAHSVVERRARQARNRRRGMRSCDGRSDPPATAPKELPKDHADDDLPALQASSDSDEDTTEVMENGPPASTARDLGSPPSVIQQIGGFITII